MLNRENKDSLWMRNVDTDEKVEISIAQDAIDFHALWKIEYNGNSRDKITMELNPENIEDEYAVELYYNETMIGHIPRSDNRHIFRLVEQGFDLKCTVREINPDEETWQMCKVKVEMIA